MNKENQYTKHVDIFAFGLCVLELATLKKLESRYALQAGRLWSIQADMKGCLLQTPQCVVLARCCQTEECSLASMYRDMAALSRACGQWCCEAATQRAAAEWPSRCTAMLWSCEGLHAL